MRLVNLNLFLVIFGENFSDQQKALHPLFQMRYDSLLYSDKWLYGSPKGRGPMVEASTTQKATK